MRDRATTYASLLAFLAAILWGSVGVLLAAALLVAGFSLFVIGGDGVAPLLLVGLLVLLASVLVVLWTVNSTMRWLIRARQARTPASTALGAGLLVVLLGGIAWSLGAVSGAAAALLFSGAAILVVAAWSQLVRE
ncbi:MAG TPA: hypothetical protein VKX16_06380 [Chloroflexota bacterium]|nr:hypothetical protein [Chloroflexota bacterium]